LNDDAGCPDYITGQHEKNHGETKANRDSLVRGHHSILINREQKTRNPLNFSTSRHKKQNCKSGNRRRKGKNDKKGAKKILNRDQHHYQRQKHRLSTKNSQKFNQSEQPDDEKYVHLSHTDYADTREYVQGFSPGSKRLELLLNILGLLGNSPDRPRFHDAWLSLQKSSLNLRSLPFWATKPVEKFARDNKWKDVPKMFRLKLDHNWRLVLCQIPQCDPVRMRIIVHVFMSNHKRQDDQYYKTILKIISKKMFL